MKALEWTPTPGGIFARGAIPHGTVEYTITRYGDAHKWQVVIEVEAQPTRRKQGRPRKGTPRPVTTLRCTTTTVAEPSLMAMKQLSQDDYRGRRS